MTFLIFLVCEFLPHAHYIHFIWIFIWMICITYNVVSIKADSLIILSITGSDEIIFNFSRRKANEIRENVCLFYVVGRPEIETKVARLRNIRKLCTTKFWIDLSSVIQVNPVFISEFLWWRIIIIIYLIIWTSMFILVVIHSIFQLLYPQAFFRCLLIYLVTLKFLNEPFIMRRLSSTDT